MSTRAGFLFQEHADFITANVSHSFVAGVIDGSLPLLNFVNYLRDEVALFQAYSRAIARLGSSFAPAACQHEGMTDLLLRLNTIQELLAREIQHRLELTGRLAAESEERLSLPPPSLSTIRASLLAGSMVERAVGTLSPARACAFLAATARVMAFIGHQGLFCQASLSSACSLGDSGCPPISTRYKPWLTRCAALGGSAGSARGSAQGLAQVVDNLLETLASIESLPKNDLHPWYAQSLRLHLSIFAECTRDLPALHTPALRPAWVGIDFDETLTSVDTTAVYAPLAAASACSEAERRSIEDAWAGLAGEYLQEYKRVWQAMLQAHGMGAVPVAQQGKVDSSPVHERLFARSTSTGRETDREGSSSDMQPSPVRSPAPRATSPGREGTGRVSQASGSAVVEEDTSAQTAQPQPQPTHAHDLPQARGLMRIQEPHRPSAFMEEREGGRAAAPARRSSLLRLGAVPTPSPGRTTSRRRGERGGAVPARPFAPHTFMAFMADWCAWEEKMAAKVSERAVLRGIRKEQLVAAGRAGKGPFRPYAAHALRALTGGVPSLPGPHPACAVVSVNWSSTFIRACLGYALALGESDEKAAGSAYALAVHAGELVMGTGGEAGGEPASTGALGGSMSTGYDKLHAMDTHASGVGVTVYVGDGVNDILPLLSATVGVVMDRGRAKGGVLARAGAPTGNGDTVLIDYDNEPGSPQVQAGSRGSLLQLCALSGITVLPLLALCTQAGRGLLHARLQHAKQRSPSTNTGDTPRVPSGHEPAARPLLFTATGWDEILAYLPGYGGEALLEATKPLLSAAEIGAAMAAKIMA